MKIFCLAVSLISSVAYSNKFMDVLKSISEEVPERTTCVDFSGVYEATCSLEISNHEFDLRQVSCKSLEIDEALEENVTNTFISSYMMFGKVDGLNVSSPYHSSALWSAAYWLDDTTIVNKQRGFSLVKDGVMEYEHQFELKRSDLNCVGGAVLKVSEILSKPSGKQAFDKVCQLCPKA